jgi:hypothetical protein
LIISAIQGQNSKKIFFSSVKNNKAHAKLLAETKMDSMIIFYQNEIVLNDALKFDTKTFAESIKNRIPKINQKGYAVLDWEGNANQILYGIKNVSDKEYNSVRNNYIQTIQYAKKLRPNIKWGFYNYPFLDFGKVSKGHDAFVRKKIMPILKNVDFLAPSIYILVDDRTETSDTFAYSYAQSNAEYAIKLGAELNKPVFPFIWHRYGSPNKSYGLIEFSYFENFIKSISDANYLGKKIDGIIWWECEDYVFNSRKTYKNVEKEYGNINNKENHIETIYRNYYKIINTNLNK